MANPNPIPFTDNNRGHRHPLSSEEPSENRGLTLPISKWKEIDRVAATLSAKEKKNITSQDVVRSLLGASERCGNIDLQKSLWNAMKKLLDSHSVP